MERPTVFSFSSLFYSQHGSYTSLLAQHGVLKLVNYIVCDDANFRKRYATADRTKGPFRVDQQVIVRPFPLPFDRPAGIRETNNLEYLLSSPPDWGELPQAVIISQQSCLSTEIKKLFTDRTKMLLYAEFFVPSDIATRKEWPLHESMRSSIERWQRKSLVDAYHADAILVPTYFAKSCWPESLHYKIHVIFDGVDTTHLNPQRIASLSSYGTRLKKTFEGKRIVAYIGRTIESIRGFDSWIKTYLKMRKARPDLHFIVLGEDKIIQRGGGSEFYYGIKSFKNHVLNSLELQEEELTDITWIPRLEFHDYLSLLSVIDVAIYPMYGMFGNWGLFQAMHMGMPIVASNRAYLPEVFKHGENGLLADPDDIDDLACCALSILEMPNRAEKMRAKAAQTIAERYSTKVAARQLSNLFDEMEIPLMVTNLL